MKSRDYFIALRSSRFDSEAKSGRSTRLGRYKGYKVQVVSSTDLVALEYRFTTTNVYDSNYEELISKLKNHNIFMLLGDAAYDSVNLFKLCDDLSM